MGNANEGSFHDAVKRRCARYPLSQMDAAKAGIVTSQMEAVAREEGLDAGWVREGVACGSIAIPANIHHSSLASKGVGRCPNGLPLRTKVNVNLGVSGDMGDVCRAHREPNHGRKSG